MYTAKAESEHEGFSGLDFPRYLLIVCFLIPGKLQDQRGQALL